MKFLSAVLLWCLNGIAHRGGDQFVNAEPPKSKLSGLAENVCEMEKNLNGIHCGRPFFERRAYYDKTNNTCVLFVPLRCGDTKGNNFASRQDCFKTCIPNSPCLKERPGIKNGTKGYTYAPKFGVCASVYYGEKAKYWPLYNRFRTEKECRQKCAPEVPLQ
uniref:BPTI/Kunitz inhibitor domain-containing protein n=1 Tax=Amblyomma maculatum TaxID=34609 RepID=G3MQ29_AMBMU